MPFPSSRIAQNHINPGAAFQLERTGKAQHHKPNVTRAALKTRNPSARSLLKRLLTKRAGAKTGTTWWRTPRWSVPHARGLGAEKRYGLCDPREKPRLMLALVLFSSNTAGEAEWRPSSAVSITSRALPAAALVGTLLRSFGSGFRAGHSPQLAQSHIVRWYRDGIRCNVSAPRPPANFVSRS